MRIGEDEVQQIYRGTEEITSIYSGDDLVFKKNLIENGSFSDGLAAWHIIHQIGTIEIIDGELHLVTEEGGGTVSIEQNIFTSASVLRVECDYRDVVPDFIIGVTGGNVELNGSGHLSRDFPVGANPRIAIIANGNGSGYISNVTVKAVN